MWGERDHRKEWVSEGSQIVSSRGHNKFTSRSHRPFWKVHACAWGDGETRTAITGEISLLDCVLCMGQSFPIRGKKMQVLVLVLISGHVVVFHVKTQFSWKEIYFHVKVFERMWHFKFQMLLEPVCILLNSIITCVQVLLEFTYVYHSEDGYSLALCRFMGRLLILQWIFLTGKECSLKLCLSLLWESSPSSELWWSTSPPRMRLILFPQFQKVLNHPKP